MVSCVVNLVSVLGIYTKGPRYEIVAAAEYLNYVMLPLP
jgi:hypothetical protein